MKLLLSIFAICLACTSPISANLDDDIELALQNGDLKKAQTCLRDSLRRGVAGFKTTSRFFDAFLQLISIEIANKELVEAKQHLEELSHYILPEKAECGSFFLRAHLLNEEKRCEEAYLVLLDLLKRHPIDFWRQHDKMLLEKLAHHQNQKYLEKIKDLRSLHPTNVSTDSLLEAYRALIKDCRGGVYPSRDAEVETLAQEAGRIAFHLREYEQAISFYEMTTLSTPQLRLECAVQWAAIGNFEKVDHLLENDCHASAEHMLLTSHAALKLGKLGKASYILLPPSPTKAFKCSELQVEKWICSLLLLAERSPSLAKTHCDFAIHLLPLLHSTPDLLVKTRVKILSCLSQLCDSDTSYSDLVACMQQHKFRSLEDEAEAIYFAGMASSENREAWHSKLFKEPYANTSFCRKAYIQKIEDHLLKAKNCFETHEDHQARNHLLRAHALIKACPDQEWIGPEKEKEVLKNLHTSLK